MTTLPESSPAKGFMHGIRLARTLALRDLKNRYASSYAGIAWHILVPLVFVVINVIVFSILVKGRMGAHYGDVPFALFYLVPFTLWSFFADVVNRSTGIIAEHRFLVHRIAFPLWILPLVPVGAALLNQAIMIAVTGVLLAYYDIVPSMSAWLYPVLWLICLFLSLGVAYIVSALAVFIPDIAQIVPIVVNIVFWLTPILYPATLVSEHGAPWVQHIILDFNPFCHIAESARQSIFSTGYPEPLFMFLLFAGSLTLCCFGIWIYRKMQPAFADVL